MPGISGGSDSSEYCIRISRSWNNRLLDVKEPSLSLVVPSIHRIASVERRNVMLPTFDGNIGDIISLFLWFILFDCICLIGTGGTKHGTNKESLNREITPCPMQSCSCSGRILIMWRTSKCGCLAFSVNTVGEVYAHSHADIYNLLTFLQSPPSHGYDFTVELMVVFTGLTALAPGRLSKWLKTSSMSFLQTAIVKRDWPNRIACCLST